MRRDIPCLRCCGHAGDCKHNAERLQLLDGDVVGFVGHEQQAEMIASPAEREEEFYRDSQGQAPI